MIELFSQCDAEYGRRVAEGLRNAPDNISKGPIGSSKSEEGVIQAEKESHEAKPY